jgi:hypothetical protein
VSALDLPAQIDEAERIGLMSADEAAWLRAYDHKVMELVHVDDFAPHELGVQGDARVQVSLRVGAADELPA